MRSVLTAQRPHRWLHPSAPIYSGLSVALPHHCLLILHSLTRCLATDETYSFLYSELDVQAGTCTPCSLLVQVLIHCILVKQADLEIGQEIHDLFDR